MQLPTLLSLRGRHAQLTVPITSTHRSDVSFQALHAYMIPEYASNQHNMLNFCAWGHCSGQRAKQHSLPAKPRSAFRSRMQRALAWTMASAWTG